MKVLFVSQYYPPEIEPSAAKVSYMARTLVAAGHKATVITGFPNYPTGVIPRQYRGKLFQTEIEDGVLVLRTFLLPSANRGLVRRSINQMSFLCSSVLRGLPVGHPDVVVVSSPPLEAGLAAYILSRVKRAPLVLEIRDVWPKGAVIVGVLRNSALIRLAEAVESLLYRHASRVISVTRGVEQHVISRGVLPYKSVLIPNGTDAEVFHPNGKNMALRAELGFADKFVVVYAGTHGLQASLASAISAADRLRDRKDIVFLFIGEGAEKLKLMQMSSKLSLSNVLFLDQQPRQKLARFLDMADAGLVHTRNEHFFEGYLPVKMFDYMASGCPVILGANGEARDLIEEADAGIWVGPEDPSAMASAIETLCDNPERCRELGRNGREYAVRHFSRSKLGQEFIDLLGDAVRGNGEEPDDAESVKRREHVQL